MSSLAYHSGEDVQAGDRIRYDGDDGVVDFVVTQKSGEAELDWFLEQFPGGGVMIVAEAFGRVFLEVEGLDDFLEFVARGTATR